MNTFLPYPSFAETARVLDRQRLGKQRVECLQILQTLLGQSKGWQNHPAVKMWRYHAMSLCNYGLAICTEWRSRGYKDTLFDKFVEFKVCPGHFGRPDVLDDPPWLGDERLHSSHRAALLYKLPSWYNQFGWVETPKIDYYWPHKENHK